MKTGQDIPISSGIFLMFLKLWDKNKNRMEKTGYGIENGLAVFSPFCWDSVLARDPHIFSPVLLLLFLG